MEAQHILKALTTVKDPKTGQDIVSRGMVKDLQVDGKNINFKLEVPQVDSLAKSSLHLSCVSVIKELDEDAEVNVHMVTMSESPGIKENDAVPQIKNIIAVGSGKGGVGKSTISVNLALGLKKLGYKVGLMDADLYGPSIPTMLGLKGAKPKVIDVHGKPKIQPLEAYGLPCVSIGFIVEPEQAVVLRGPRLAGIIKQFFEECVWPDLDFLIVDLPPGTGDIQLTLVQTVPVTGAVVVTTPQDVAIDDAIKAGNMFRLPNVQVPILGVVENMSWFSPPDDPAKKYYIFGQGGGANLAKSLDTKLLGNIPIVEEIRERGDMGIPAVLKEGDVLEEHFMEMSKAVSEQVKLRNLNQSPTKVVDVQG